MHLLPLSCLGSISFFHFSGLLVYLRFLASGRPSSGGYVDPRFKRVLWYLIGSTKGGVNRAKIIELLNSRPANPNQIANQLKLDYKTVLHHLKVLSDNGLIITDNRESYGAAYFLTPIMENNYQSFVEILAKIKRSSGNAG